MDRGRIRPPLPVPRARSSPWRRASTARRRSALDDGAVTPPVPMRRCGARSSSPLILRRLRVDPPVRATRRQPRSVQQLRTMRGRGTQFQLDELAEVVAARFEAVVPVEAGAARRQQRRRRRDGQLSRRRRRPRPSTRRAIGAPRAASAGANVAATSSAASPIATTARMRSGVGRHRREVEALVPPAGDEHDVVEGADRHGRGVRGGGLGVVVPAPRRRPRRRARCGAAARGTRRARWPRASAPASPVSITSAAAASALVTSWGSARRIAAHLGDRPARPGRARPTPSAGRRGSRRRSRRTSRGGPARRRRCSHHHGVVDEADRHVVGALVGEDACLGVGVGRRGRGAS